MSGKGGRETGPVGQRCKELLVIRKALLGRVHLRPQAFSSSHDASKASLPQAVYFLQPDVQQIVTFGTPPNTSHLQRAASFRKPKH